MNKVMGPVWQDHLAVRESCSRRGDLETPCATCGAKEFNICEPLDPARQAKLFSQATRLAWPARTSLFRVGDAAKHVFNITEGTVALSRTMGDGRRQIFGFLLAGDFAGLEVGPTYSFDAETVTETRACRFERNAFNGFMGEHADVATRLVRMVSNDLVEASRHEMLLGRKTAVERVASFLLDLRLRSNQRHLRTSPLALPMTRTEIADYAGLTIETVSRVFSRLKKAGVIDLDGNHAVRVIDAARLAALSEKAD